MSTGTNTGSPKKKGIIGSWYAWVVSAGGLLTQLANLFALSVWGLNLAMIAQQLGVQPADLALGSSLFGVLTAASGFIWGNIADRIGPRTTLSIATFGIGVFICCIALFANSVETVILFYALAGACAGGVGSAVLPKLISAWYTAKWRGKGYVVVTLGGSISGIIFGFIAPIFVLNGGWQACFMAIGIIALVSGVLAFILCRDYPAKLGTVPFGSPAGTEVKVPEKPAETAEEKAARKAENRKKMIEVLKMPITWKFGIVYILWYFYFMANNAFRGAAILGAGFDVVVAGLVGSVLTATMAIGQVIFASLSDRFSRKKIFALMSIVGGIVYFAMYWVLGAADATVVLVYFGILGFFLGAPPVMQTMMAESYPTALRGSGPGVITTLGLIGRFFGPILAGFAIGLCAGYTPGYALFAGGALILSGIVAFFFLPNTGGKYGDPMADITLEEIAESE